LRANTHAHFRHFASVSARLTLRVLRGQVAQARQHLTISGERLAHCTRSLLRSRRDRFAGLEVRLKASRLANAQAQRNAIARERERTQRLAERAHRALMTALQRLEARVTHRGQLLSALSYRSVLERGFALVRDDTDHPVHAAAQVGPAARLSIEFADGRVGATADTDRPAATREPARAPSPATREQKPAAPKRAVKPADQGSLF
jgi:exodeoxyribonuclease VII large subunit